MSAGMEPYESYRPSVLPWLGQLPSHWDELPMAAIGTIRSEKNLADRELLSVYLDRGVIRFSDVEKKRTNVTSEDLSGYQAVEVGDLVLNNQQAWRGSVGVSSHSGIISPAYIVLKLSKSFNGSFANYLFRDPIMVAHFLMSSKGVGTIQRNLYWPQLKRCRVIVPPLIEQLRITSFLDERTTEIDQAIQKKKQLSELLSEQRSVLINRAVTKGLSPDAPMQNSGVDWIGEIPAHWKVSRLKYLFQEKNSRTKTGEETLFSLRMIKGLVPHDEVSDKPISDDDLVDYKHVTSGQMVMNRMRAAIGIFGVANSSGLVSPDYAVFDMSDAVNHDYFLKLFKTTLMGLRFRLSSKGLGTGSSGFMRLYTENFGDLKVAVPPVTEQAEISDYITELAGPFEDAESLIQQEISALNEFKKTLIANAVTGKIKI